MRYIDSSLIATRNLLKTCFMDYDCSSGYSAYSRFDKVIWLYDKIALFAYFHPLKKKKK